MSNELNALSILDKYEQFPKVVKVDWEHFTIYMTYVGISIEEISNEGADIDLQYQATELENNCTLNLNFLFGSALLSVQKAMVIYLLIITLNSFVY